ncbi:MAG: S8 family peptidase [Coprobacillaceae bacterium]
MNLILYIYVNINHRINKGGENIETNQIEIIVKYGGDLEVLKEDIDMDIEYIGENYAIITLEQKDVSNIYPHKQVEYVEIPKILTPQLSREMDASCIPIVQNPNFYGLTGKGTIVAIIDSGIEYTHPDFIVDGKSRILYIWDQTIDGNPPKGFIYGTEYNNEEINQALLNENPRSIVPQTDRIGHGTAIAGIACGNGTVSNQRQIGAAPEASIIVVKLRRYEANTVLSSQIMRAIRYSIIKAEEVNMPIAINISYGTNSGSHDGSSLFESYIDDISNTWKTSIVVAAGNEGASGHHYQGYLESNSYIDVTFKVAPSIYHFYMTLWKNFVDSFTFQLIAPNGEISEILSYANKNFIWQVESMNIQGVYLEPNYYTENQEILYAFDGNNNMMSEGIWTLRIMSTDVFDGNYNIWMPTVEEVTTGTAFSYPTNNNTLTILATCKKVISVGGYDISNSTCLYFSGQGTIALSKPDLVAPGNNVLTTSTNGGYDSYTGTSIAAPFVTGSIALMMEWGIVNGNDPFLYGQRVKAFLKKGTSNKNIIRTFNTCFGYGILCLKATMDLLVAYKKGGGNDGEIN